MNSMQIDRRIKRFCLYGSIVACGILVITETVRLIFSNRSLHSAKLQLNQEQIFLKHALQYPQAINYINTVNKFEDFGTMLNFRLHDLSCVKILHAKDENGLYKRKLQISCKTVDQLHNVMNEICNIEGGICIIDKLTQEKNKDNFSMTVELYYYNK